MTPAADAVPDALFRLTLLASPAAVRAGLAGLTESPPMQALSAEHRATAEIVLAEVLNNIAEHAYGGKAGMVAISLQAAPGGLDCCITDQGREMPAGKIPEGTLPGEELPEGGFGWYLIRSLTQALSYQRANGENILRFRVPG